VCFLLSALCLLLAVAVRAPLTIALTALALGIQAAAVPVATTSWVGDRAKAEDRPYTWAAIGVWSNMGTGLAILLGQSLLARLGGWPPAFVAFAVCYVACAALATRLT
jgi:MFS family permease